MSTSTAANGSAALVANATESNLRDAGSASAGGNPGVTCTSSAARMRATLLNCVTEDDMAAVAKQLVLRAREGNLSAIKLLLRYILQEPSLAKSALPRPAASARSASAPAPKPQAARVAERLSAEALAEGLQRLEFGPSGDDRSRSPMRVADGLGAAALSPKGKTQVDSLHRATDKAASHENEQPGRPSSHAKPAAAPAG